MSNLLTAQLVCAVSLVTAIIFFRLGWLPFKGFSKAAGVILLLWLIVGVFSLFSVGRLLLSNGSLTLFPGLSALVPLVLIFWLGSVIVKARSVPPIHQISTDIENPPEFKAALSLRHEGDNPIVLTPEVTAQQMSAYDHIQPIFLADVDILSAYDLALQTAEELGWQVHHEHKAKVRFEATDTSALFGFVDDIVVRITRVPQKGSLVDVRSISRVGVSDLGANARRIEQFSERIQQPR